jgi:hypothetical protein
VKALRKSHLWVRQLGRSQKYCKPTSSDPVTKTRNFFRDFSVDSQAAMSKLFEESITNSVRAASQTDAPVSGVFIKTFELHAGQRPAVPKAAMDELLK